MTTLTLKGNQIGEALQFQTNGTTTTVEIGRVWFSATDTVTITFAPGAVDANGVVVGGNNAITSFSVTTASGQVTTFFTSPDGLDVETDPGKTGSDFFAISENPASGLGGAYAGLQLEKLVISETALLPGTSPVFSNVGSYIPAAGTVTPPPPAVQLIGDAGNNILTGNELNNVMEGRDGNDTMRSLGGNDQMNGGRGNDRMDGGTGNDVLRGGEGNDRMLGGAGVDRLLGEAGGDVMDGGAGADVLTGGAGGDTFVFGAGDRVTDFNAGQGDEIVFLASLGLDLADIQVTFGASGTTIAYGNQVMTLQGVTEPFDLGNHIKFDHQPSFDFV